MVDKRAVTEYAELRGIDIKDLDTKKAVKKIEEWVREKTKNYKEALYCTKKVGKTECKFPIMEEDTFCGRCGADVSENDDGGLAKYLADKMVKEPAGKKPTDKKTEKPADKKNDKDKKKPPPGPTKTGRNESGFIPDETRTLADRTKRIHELEQEGGVTFHKIGGELSQIADGKHYSEGGHETFEDFVASLGYTFGWARGLIKVFNRMTEPDAQRLGAMKSIVVAAAPPETRKKLLKSAKTEELTTAEIQEKVKDDRDPSTPSKQKTKFRALLEVAKLNVRLPKDGSSVIKAIPEPGGDDEIMEFIGVEVIPTKAGVSFQFVELELPSGENTEA